MNKQCDFCVAPARYTVNYLGGPGYECENHRGKGIQYVDVKTKSYRPVKEKTQ